MKRGLALAPGETVDNAEVDRRGQRHMVNVSASLRRGSERVAVITLRNLSRYGFMAEGSGQLDIGETLILDVAGVAADVYIAWALAGRIGGEFMVALEQRALAQIIAEDQDRG